MSDFIQPRPGYFPKPQKGDRHVRHTWRDKDDLQTRIEKTREVLNISKKPGNQMRDWESKTPQKQVTQTGYFAQPNVKKFQTVIAAHMFDPELKKKKGGTGFFYKVDDLRQEFADFVMLCQETETVPTVSALTCYLGCDRRVLYDHVNNPNSPFAQDCKNMLDFCHMCLENGATENKLNSVAYIFQAKNYFGMRDTQDVQVTATTSQDMNNDQTFGALKEQIAHENQLRLDKPKVTKAKPGETISHLKETEIIEVPTTPKRGRPKKTTTK